jgi:predicted dehydrogenase
MKGSKKIRVGIVGCGNISNAYFQGLGLFPDLIEVAACADLDVARARAKAAEKGVAKAGTVKQILQDPDIDLIVNLTVPKAHAEINRAALLAGKHAYCEKPFSVTKEEGQKVLALAKMKKLRVGTAPDTFLGAGLQTCRKLIDDGRIGRPIGATAFMVCAGHESWHPSPGFYYEKGGGPLFDMGPYYLTALVSLMGPVKRVSASAQKTYATRTITSNPLKGKKIKVATPTHYSGTLDFANGAVATVIMSFDVWGAKLPRLEIYGTKGTLGCPDPNVFHDENSVYLKGMGGDWQTVPLVHPFRVGRGMGVADMAKAILARRAHRCSGEMGYHVVEVMQAFEESSRRGRHVAIQSTCAQPKALPGRLKTGEMD